MNIILTKSSMIRPAEEMPKKTLWLSRLDMIGNPYRHSRTLFIYQDQCKSKINIDAKILRESLSKVLVAFYPMAGRLKMNECNGRYEIDCNGEGAFFVEAETTQTLDEFQSGDDFRKLMVPKCDYTRGLSSFPLVMAQLTHFKCGGVCLGIAHHHHAFDGLSSAFFNSSWARIARGLDIAVLPVHDRVVYFSPRDPPRIKFPHTEFQPSLPPLYPKDISGKVYDAIECNFKLSEDEIEALKLQATSEDNPKCYKLSTFEILAGHVWRCATKARGLADDQDVKLCVPVSGRSRLRETLPEGYCGNVLLYPKCTAKAKDIVDKSIGDAASKVHEMIKQVNDAAYFRSAIDYLESQPYLEPFIRNADSVTCPNMSINNWRRFSVDEVDFGWGPPKRFLHGGVKFEGQAFFVPSADGDGSLSLAIKLFKPHMARFEGYFYAIGNRVKEGQLGWSKGFQSASRL